MKSPVASLCLVCSSVRKRVRVMMWVLTFSVSASPFPFVATIVSVACTKTAPSLARCFLLAVCALGDEKWSSYNLYARGWGVAVASRVSSCRTTREKMGRGE